MDTKRLLEVGEQPNMEKIIEMYSSDYKYLKTISMPALIAYLDFANNFILDSHDNITIRELKACNAVILEVVKIIHEMHRVPTTVKLEIDNYNYIISLTTSKDLPNTNHVSLLSVEEAMNCAINNIIKEHKRFATTKEWANS